MIFSVGFPLYWRIAASKHRSVYIDIVIVDNVKNYSGILEHLVPMYQLFYKSYRQLCLIVENPKIVRQHIRKDETVHE